MKKYQVFIGDIRKCTRYDMENIFMSEDYATGTVLGHTIKEDELYKKDAILVKVTEGSLSSSAYVDLESIKSSLDMIKLKKYITKGHGWTNNSLMIPTHATGVDSLFVDVISLRPYYEGEIDKNISVKQLKKEIKEK